VANELSPFQSLCRVQSGDNSSVASIYLILYRKGRFYGSTLPDGNLHGPAISLELGIRGHEEGDHHSSHMLRLRRRDHPLPFQYEPTLQNERPSRRGHMPRTERDQVLEEKILQHCRRSVS
jgi:hypothetical protein